jgi:ABC-type amino acid transport substrate-binding protein
MPASNISPDSPATGRRTLRLALAGLALVALLLAATVPAHAQRAGYPEWQKPKRLVFGMPYIGNVIGPDETGLITTVLKEIFTSNDLDFEHRNLPYDRALAGLQQGTIHCSLTLKGHRDMKIQGESTIIIYNLAVAYRAKDGFHGVETMEGERVASMYGFELQKLLPVKVLVQTGYDLTSILHLLDRGHVKYVLDESRLLREGLLEAQLPTNEFGIHTLRSLEVHPIFAPTDEGREFKALYDRRMKEMAGSGRLREIYRSYGMSKDKIDHLFKVNGY